MLKLAFSGALVLSLVSGAWLYQAYSYGNRTTQWPAVSAMVTDNAAEVSATRPGRRGVKSWATSVTYTVDGVEYNAVLDDYLVGNNATVYVNPENPREAVGETGPRMQDTFYPIVATAFSGCLALVIALIAFSPKDD